MAWWWCLDHKQVEEGLGCGSTTRLGPYDKPELAATAMDRVRKRGAAQAAKDKADENWDKKR